LENQFGYTSADVTNEAYFVSKEYTRSGTFTQIDLKPAVYYYKAKKISKDSHCPESVVKDGSFKILSGQTTTIDVKL